jgi:aminoglycoside phosphotransferase (APT) family kinase protein
LATAGRSSSITSTDLAARLAASARARLGADVTVEGLTRLPGGASREIWLFTARHPDGHTEPLVLRRDPPGHVIESSRASEFALLETAAAAGVPVPRVRWCAEEGDGLGSAFVMDFVAGETIARKLLRDDEYAAARAALPEQLAAALARIHAMDLAAPSFAHLARPDGGASPAAAELARYDGIYRAIAPDPHPAFELAFRWLGAGMPTPRRLAVVHGDYRVGNVIVGAEGLRAVIDWELTHVGDPMEDVGWLCVRSWRFGAAAPVGGLCERDRFFAAYERAGGDPVDPAAARWWEVFGNLKWGIITIMQAQTFLGGVKNVELASLGRRTCETELELLELLEVAAG